MNVQTVTIKYNGEYHEFQAADLDMSQTNPADREVLNAIMVRLNINDLTGFVVDPPENERNLGQHDTKTVLNVRPTATYGLS